MATAEGNSEEQKINAPTQQPEMEFTSETTRITTDFDQCFPKMMTWINNFAENVNLPELQRVSGDESNDKLYNISMKQLLDLAHDELMNVLGQPWDDLKKQNETFVARHSLLVLICVVRDPLYAQTRPELQNVLKWAALLHDIAKMSRPTIDGRDHVHPFKSGMVLLEIFERIGFVPAPGQPNEQQLKENLF